MRDAPMLRRCAANCAVAPQTAPQSRMTHAIADKVNNSLTFKTHSRLNNMNTNKVLLNIENATIKGFVIEKPRITILRVR